MPLIQPFEPGKKVILSNIDANCSNGAAKEQYESELSHLAMRVKELADLMYFAGRNSLLLVLQGMDTSGKDGAIRCLLQAIDSQGAHSYSFKVPTAKELSHDFLWRCHANTPGKGGISIFNRSHFEDVLVVRVHGLVPEEKWQKRYEHINHFENLLADNETIILKYFLHISKEDQEQRLIDREKDVEKSWKLNVGDWKDRELWEKYQEAYEDAIGYCNSAKAPWFIVPANKKWYRNLAILESIIIALEPYEEKWLAHLEQIGTKAKAELAEFRAQK